MKIEFFKKQDFPEGTVLPKPPTPPTLRLLADSFEFRFNQPLLKLLGCDSKFNLVGFASDGGKQWYLFRATQPDDPYTLKLPEHTMHPVQRIETKRAFMGACGMMLQLLHNEIPALPEDEAMNMLEQMTLQVQEFFQTEGKAEGGAHG